jgi:hypothetical protein
VIRSHGPCADLQQLQRVRRSIHRTGWPSPKNAEIAIDDAEYDLAIIRC